MSTMYRRLLLLKTSLTIESWDHFQVIEGPAAPLGKLIVPLGHSTGPPLADTGAFSPSRFPRKARFSKSPSDRPCRYSSGINSGTFLVLIDAEASALSELLLGTADSRPPQLYRSELMRKPPGSGIRFPIAGIAESDLSADSRPSQKRRRPPPATPGSGLWTWLRGQSSNCSHSGLDSDLLSVLSDSSWAVYRLTWASVVQTRGYTAV